ncbi:hypothetical protein D779_1638 [Imhoffiella purpurea]|uniref:Uncharacterized protein n=1 Tax=Imhoffiella purpurea TaxID=1249627 RepID=W9V6R1_9GAMM|nr:hypothetical protein D779_1638 [Imhoffiella purpurea]
MLAMAERIQQLKRLEKPSLAARILRKAKAVIRRLKPGA